MPNNFKELETLLNATSSDLRCALGELIDAGFGTSGSLLCDHVSFLRAGMIGQMFDRRDYKQLVTDVADRVGINWELLTKIKPWSQLSASEIEAAIVGHIDRAQIQTPDTQAHIPDLAKDVLKYVALGKLILTNPLLGFCSTPLNSVLDDMLSHLSTDWRKLLVVVVFVNRVVRPSLPRQLT